MTHLKGLLRKEWYLLKENGGWPSFQVLVVVVLGFLLGNYDSADYFKDLQEKSFFTSSYTSGNTQGGFVYNDYDFNNCHDPSGPLFRKTQIIGIVADNDSYGIVNESLAEKINNRLKHPVSFIRFDSERELRNFALKPEGGELCMGVKFEKNGFDFEYTLYLDNRDFGSFAYSEKPYDELAFEPDIEFFEGLKVVGGYMPLLYSSIAKIVTNEYAQFTYIFSPSIAKDVESAATLRKSLPGTCKVYYFICITFALLTLIIRLQREKHSKIRSFMRIMGMSDSSYYISHLIFFAAYSFGIAILMTVFGKVFYLKKVNVLIIFIQCYLMLMSVFFFALLSNSIFNGPLLGNICTMVIYIITLVIMVSFFTRTGSSLKMILFSLNPQMAAYASLMILDNVSYYSDGISFTELFTNYNNYSVVEGWFFIIFDCAILLFIAVYLDNIFCTYGYKKPWYYFLTTNYWCPGKRLLNEETAGRVSNEIRDEMVDGKTEKLLTTNGSDSLFEEVSHDLRAQKDIGECFEIEKMTKQFEDGKLAVKDFTLDIYKGQVFILLGHNGAGKTTALLMLTGFLCPTSGRAFIKGIDAFKDYWKMNQILGVCPQESIFFENLTVEQNLNIFYALKNLEYNPQSPELQNIITSLEFRGCLGKKAKDLSGGHKRKLSILLALVGSPAVIILDEPTSGVDVYFRKQIWEMIRRIKKDKIILMTTHCMDEAEALGDRIAIMTDGELKCCGSSLFLKRQYRTGYNLTMVKTPSFNQEITNSCLKTFAGNYYIAHNTVTEVVYNVPFESANKFPQMFEEFDKSLVNLGISSYGVAVTSLEDVFLKVNEDHNKSMEEEGIIERNFSISGNAKILPKSNALSVMRNTLLKLIRDPHTLALEILIPIIILVIGLASEIFDFKGTYSYALGSMPHKLPVVINSRLPNSSDFRSLKENLSFDYLDLDIDLNNSSSDNILKFYASNHLTYKDVPHFGGFYVDSIYLNDFRAMIVADPRWPQMTTYLSNVLTNAYLRTYNPKVTITPKFTFISIFNYSLFDGIIEDIILICLAALIGVVYVILIISLARSVFKEREAGYVFIELLHGLSSKQRWIGRFLADHIKLIFTFSIMIILIKIAEINIPYFALVAIGSIWSFLPFTYFISSFPIFSKRCVFLIITLTFLSAVVALVLLRYSLTLLFAAIIDSILRILPPYNIMDITIALAIAGNHKSSADDIIWSYSGLIGWSIWNIIGFVFYSFIVYLIEKREAKKKISDIPLILNYEINPFKDEDVKREEERIQSELPINSTVYVCGAKKKFDHTTAVNDVSFTVQNNEVFALLGVNGAGKTTMLKMLTLQEKPDSGRFYLNGINMHLSDNERVKHYDVGYCPQKDILFDHLTVKEHLRHFAIIKGIPEDIRKRAIKVMLRAFNFGENINKKASELSGGNKRKLCTAIALLGHPKILLLDEPTTGLDPKSRRIVWDIILREAYGEVKPAVVLISHSMEEIEALSTKVAIMVEGSFRCLGSTQHLKSKYGNSYNMELTIQQPPQTVIQRLLQQYQVQPDNRFFTIASAQAFLNNINMHAESSMLTAANPRGVYIFQCFDASLGVTAENLVEFVLLEQNINTLLHCLREKFLGLNVIEETAMKLRLQIPRCIGLYLLTFSELFKYSEQLKTLGYISDYTICETTLEYIFRHFARQGNYF